MWRAVVCSWGTNDGLLWEGYCILIIIRCRMVDRLWKEYCSSVLFTRDMDKYTTKQRRSHVPTLFCLPMELGQGRESWDHVPISFVQLVAEQTLHSKRLFTCHEMNKGNPILPCSEGGPSFWDHQGKLISVWMTHPTPEARESIERCGWVNQGDEGGSVRGGGFGNSRSVVS